MKIKIIFIILLTILTTITTFIACETKPTKPEYNNVFDPGNPTTAGDPFQLQVVIGNGGVTLTWTKPSSANLAGFKIYRSENETTGYSALSTVSATTTQYVDRTVQNGHSYWYRIAALDGSGNETSTTNVSTMHIKTDPLLVINSGDLYTPTKEVNLTILANTAQQMMLSNASDFSGKNWETYTTSKSWTLLTGDGEKMVYLKVQYSDGTESPVVADTISPQPMNPSMVINNDDAYTPNINVSLQLAATGAAEMYISNTSFSQPEGSQGIGDEVLFQKVVESEKELKNKTHTKKTKTELEVKSSIENEAQLTESWEPFSANKNWNLITGDGNKGVYVKFKNDFEIETSTINDEIVLDITPPTPILAGTPDSGIINEAIFRFDPTASYDNIFSINDLQIRYDYENDGTFDTNW